MKNIVNFPAQIATLPGRTHLKSLTHYVQQVIRLAALKLRTDQKNSYLSNTCAVAVCKYKTPNRLDRLFYPLILYDTTCLCKLPNRSDGLFYPLTLDGLFTYCASYQIGQTDSFILWHLTAYLLYKIPNRSIDTRRLFRN